MTPEEQAKALSEWLEKPPGNPPPEGIDKDVLEAIYVFQPERAPAANLTVEDILQLVEEGPFARENPQQETHESSKNPGIVVLSQERRKRRRLWSGAGAIAAAAAVLIIALPQQDEASQIGPQMVPSPAAERSIPAPPPAEIEVTDEEASLFKKEKEHSEPPPIGRPDNQQRSIDKAPETAELDDALEANQEAAKSDLVGVLGSLDDAGSEALGGAYTGTGSGGGGIASQSRSGGISRGSASNADNFAQGAAVQPMEEYNEVATPAPAPEPASRRNRVFQQSKRKQQPAAASSTAEIDFESMEMEEEEDEPEDKAPAQAQSTTALEALALPSDYLPPTFKSEVPTQWEIAESARGLMIKNKPNEALALAVSGLSLSSKNTPELSMLHYVIGRTSRQLNQDSAARAAYEKAIALNALR